MCMNLLFLYAYSGCDTTSLFDGFRKQTVFKLLLNNLELQTQFKIFTSVNYSQKEIEVAGLKATLALYGGRKNESIANLCARIMSENFLNSSVFVGPEKLPPTEGSLKYHSYRTYHQIMTWMREEMNGENWGWYIRDSKIFPGTMDHTYAPDKLLKVVHCSCKTGCTTLQCTCKRSGLSCTYICGTCKVDGCSNVDKLDNIAPFDDEYS